MRRAGPTLLFLLGIGVAVLPPSALRAANCTVTATPLAFGKYDPLSAAPRNRNARITLTCNGQGTFIVALSTGESGSYDPRYMTGGAGSDQLNYNLYTSVAHTSIFGDGTNGTRAVSQRFKNNTKRVTVYGQIPAMENIAAGNYSDTITVSVTF